MLAPGAKHEHRKSVQKSDTTVAPVQIYNWQEIHFYAIEW